MAMPNNFQISSESSIASYNAMDAATGTGYVTYYPSYATSSQALAINALDSTTPYTTAIITAVDVGMTGYTKIIDLDFDLTYKRPQTLEGDSLVNYTIKNYSNSNGHNTQCYGIVRIRKVNSSGVESDLVTATSGVFLNSAGTTYGERILEILAVPKTSFAIGEKLRVTIEIWAVKNIAGFIGEITLYHDPSNRVPLASASKTFTSYTNHDTNILVNMAHRIDL